MPQETLLVPYLLDFSGLSSPAWAPPTSGRGERAIEARALARPDHAYGASS
ncbi:hypothetical protein [Bradyrhizobium sp. WU425]|uniref:hypothetical protein n=1 Tax=Bradyrhizobium sp. WU425 TaxID=187029 RepID=UPI001E4D99E2|nr:hypothetical protein [Bradyrhizobium canariense]UFW72866.1 hypothetical protein BcanWU425_03600 [Bradyrhizobium canariense]